MSRVTTQGECKFAYPVHGNDSLVRTLMETPDGWSICAVNRKVAEQFKGKPLEPVDTFDMQKLIDTATRRFIGDRSIVDDDPQYTIRLAAGVLMFAVALGVIRDEDLDGR